MSKFTFQLAPLLSYRRHRRDMCRQLFAQIVSDDEKLVEQFNQLEVDRQKLRGEINELATAGRMNIDAISARRFYTGQLGGQQKMVVRQREVLKQQLDLCRRALTQADQEVKVIEKLEEKALSQHTARTLTREQRELEESWSAGRLTGVVE